MVNKNKKNLVIIGGAGAGMFCGATVMQLSKEFDVYMISSEELFCRCSGPYVLKDMARMQDTVMPDEMITQFGIKLLKGEALSVDGKKKEVIYGNSKSSASISYDALVFATGARAFIPPTVGVDLKNVFSVRTPEDIKKINAKSKNAKKAIVVGGGVIGVEMASALMARDVDVSVMIVEKKPFELLATDEFCDLILDNLKKDNIKILSESMISEIYSDKSGCVAGVVYKSADKEEHKLKADMIVYATGVRANKELAESIGINTNRAGIIVDDFMRSSKKDVFAVGDVCVSKSAITGEKMPSQLATNAVIQGKIAGKNIAGMKTRYAGHTTATVLDFSGREYGSCGLTEKACVVNGIDYYVGRAVSTDIYKDIKGAVQVDVKIVFNKKNNRVIGVECFGRNLVWIVNLISFAIVQKSTIFDLNDLDYASHPTVSAWPFMNPVIMCCESALNRK